MRIIGLTGLANTGKDTTADFLCKHYNFKKISFAQPIRDGLEAMLGVSTAQMMDREKKEEIIPIYGKSPRQLMQTLGTEWGRTHVASDVWLRAAAVKIANIESTGWYSGVVISDVRFPNEVAWVRTVGEAWFIEREGGGLASTHASEQIPSPEQGEVILQNNGTFDDLYNEIKRHMEVK